MSAWVSRPTSSLHPATERSGTAVSGADQMAGAPGETRLRGGTGSDELWGVGDFVHADGWSYVNELWGGPGPDTLHGRSIGNEVLAGAGGNDTILAAGGDDVLWGGPGADVLRGGDGRDNVRGGPGDDRLVAGNGDDALWGDSPIRGFRPRLTGDDVLLGGPGNDAPLRPGRGQPQRRRPGTRRLRGSCRRRHRCQLRGTAHRAAAEPLTQVPLVAASGLDRFLLLGREGVVALQPDQRLGVGAGLGPPVDRADHSPSPLSSNSAAENDSRPPMSPNAS